MQESSPAAGSNEAVYRDAEKRFLALRAENLKLDMTRGKPSVEQLDLSLGLLDCVNSEHYLDEDGADCRNYPPRPDGIPAAKELFAHYLGVAADEVIVGGNSSLTLMHNAIRDCMLHGTHDAPPWTRAPRTRFLCPVPGYDRHFTICEYFGIEMIPVPMDTEGPVMDDVEALVADDSDIKGMWCVPKYSNPTGTTYSRETLERLARMDTAAQDFRIFFDNAYAVHDLLPARDELENIMDIFRAEQRADRALVFGSTSKISFAGGGVSAYAASRDNIAHSLRLLGTQTIGPDQLNQLRHVRFFGDMNGIRAHMAKHAALVRPKFEAVDATLQREFEGLDLVTWTRPNGGYFLSLDTPPGCASRVVALAGEAGVKLTPAGATFPYGKDPEDRNIRIAPTVPPAADVAKATELLAVCIKKVCFAPS